MARRPRIEIEGGLYHIITRGVDRQDIFHSPEDHRKFLALLSIQKEKLPFYLYAYCLMTNHLHLLLERRLDDIGRIMHRVLTGYGQYYNRRYRSKHSRSMTAKETSIIAGRRLGATTTVLSRLLSISSASVSRRFDTCANKLSEDETFASLADRVMEEYKRNVARES